MTDEIIDVAWRNGGTDSFGIVAVKRVDGWKSYMGIAYGYDVRVDAEHIARFGAPLFEHEARAFFPHLENEPYAY